MHLPRVLDRRVLPWRLLACRHTFFSCWVQDQELARMPEMLQHIEGQVQAATEKLRQLRKLQPLAIRCAPLAGRAPG